MVETVSHTNYEVYDVTSFSGGNVTINIDSIVHLNKNGWDGTIGVYFLDINNNPVGQNFDAEATSWYPSLAGVTDDQYNQIVLIPDLIRPADGGTPYTNVSFNVPVPSGATQMFWFVWINAGPSNPANYNWDLISGDKFFLTESYYQNDITHAGYAKRTYPRRYHFGPDGQTIVQSPVSEVRGQVITTTAAAINNALITATSHNGSSKYYIKSDGVTTNGKLSYYNSSNTELFYWEGITVTGEPYVNQGPTVVVPDDTTVGENTIVTLSSAGTFDPEGDTLTYTWTQMAGPAVTLRNANTPVAEFTTPQMHWSDSDIVFTFTLAVSDGINPTVYGTVNVTAQADGNLAPQTTAISYFSDLGGDTVTYADSSTYDPDGDTLTFAWTQVSGPTVTITDTTARDIEVTLPTIPYGDPNVAILRATITDTGGLTATREYRITIVTEANQAPVAIATANKDNPNAGEVVTLSGVLSTDPEGHGLTYSWSAVSSTDGTTPALSDYSAVSPSFTSTAIAEGGVDVVLVYRLTVTDNGGLSSTDDVVITVKAPVAVTTPNCTRCNICYSIEPIATQMLENTGNTAEEARTYDLYTGQIVHDGTSVMSTFTYTVDGGATYDVGYLGDNNIIYASRTQTAARTKYDLETYGYSYVLNTPVATVGENEIQFVVVE